MTSANEKEKCKRNKICVAFMLSMVADVVALTLRKIVNAPPDREEEDVA